MHPHLLYAPYNAHEMTIGDSTDAARQSLVLVRDRRAGDEPTVAPTKEAQRAELHRTAWCIANDLRGSVDGWDFKDYVLELLFYRFISENLTASLSDLEGSGG